MPYAENTALLFLLGGIAIVVAVIGYTAQRLWRLYVNQRAQKKVDQRESQKFKDAERERTAAKSRLNSRAGNPIVIEVINDITSDVMAGGAEAFVDFDSAQKAMEAIKEAGDHQTIDVVLHTLGGFSTAAEMIAAALKNRKGLTRAYVPYIAMSAGTMIALACKEIHLGKNAVLGPIDTQYAGYSLSSWGKLANAKSPDAISDVAHLTMFEVERFRNHEFQTACDLLNEEHRKKDGDQTCRVVFELMSRDRPHSQLIGLGLAKDIGIAVKDGCPTDVYELVNARAQMIRRNIERTAAMLSETNRARHRRQLRLPSSTDETELWEA